jgi:glycosyltransferase involved in cell wall biosynthesis
LVVVSPWPYHPTCGIGGGVVCFELLQRLADAFDIHFVSFDQVPNDTEAGHDALARACASVTVLPAPRPVRGARDVMLQSVQAFTRRPREVRDAWSPTMAAAVARLAREHAPAAVILQFPQMAQYAAAAASAAAAVVVDVQDACMVSRYREWRSAAAPLRRAARFVAWLAWLRYELRWYARADALIAISENDLGVLRSFIPEVPCVYSPVAADTVDAGARGPEGSYVALIGNFAHAPNRDALEWLLSEIWPLVRARVASAELHVAGPDIPGWAAGRDGEGVVVRGFVESVDAFYGQAQMALVPYRFGGGTKIKALEAMAHGCPVVATTIGSEGLQVTPGVHLRVADDARGFAHAIVELMLSPDSRRTLADAARSHIERHFSWDAKVTALVEMLRAVGARNPKARAPV